MKGNSELVKVIKNFYQKLCQISTSEIKEQSLWLLRTYLITKKQSNWVNAGFVLPTVAMVALVVVLLTTAILFRSFERSKNASNVRVNEVVLNAATPAIDRAQTKIAQLFNDPTLPRSTPAESSLYNALTKDIKKYTFGDETPLELRYDINSNKTIDKTGDLEDQEAITTAWKFPVDTDNNGLYDTYTLYGVFFRSPSRGTDGKFDRVRNPLEARTPPMDDGSLGGICSAAKGTSSSLVGESGWYKAGASIKKSFFVYVVNVPNYTKDDTKKLEKYKGNKGVSALEFQEDQERIPVVSNAVVYEDDLEITPGRGLSINGSIFTNSNLLTARTNNDAGREVRFYQVSSPKSCFYQAQNSKIIVGGNVGNGRITGEGEGRVSEVHLFKPGSQGITAQINSTNKSASNTAGQIAYNTKAFAERIDAQVQAVMGTDTSKFKDYSKDPKEVRDKIKARINDNPGLEVVQVRREELESYFKKRTRRVPFPEALLTDAAPSVPTLQGESIEDSESGEDTLRGPDAWIYPTDTNTKLTLSLKQLSATEPNKLKEIYKDEEKLVGDRVLVGNNLPALWFNKTISAFVGRGFPQQVDNNKTEWDDWEDPKYKYRTRTTRVQELISLGGLTDRDGYFEDKATEQPKNPLDNVGGMRVITGAGIYVDGPSSDTDASYPWDEDIDSDPATTTTRSFFAGSRPSWDTSFVDPTPTSASTDGHKINVSSLKFNDKGTLKNPIVVYPDSMPMTGGFGTQPTQKGDLLMRATAVYHYANNSGNNQTPIACVSSYYNPTNAITAQNESTFTSKWKNPDADTSTIAGKSNNGIVYPAPYTSPADRNSAITTYSKQLRQQARLVFPDGRFVNEPLRKALKKVDDNETLSMADNSAIDTTICAIQILSGTPSSSPPVPHGAIYETAFLDARQIKSVEKQSNVSSLITEPYYDRSLEERQPLEVRVTVLDLDQLRKTTIETDEYLLPNSGIIYATRDDALADLSTQPGGNINTSKLLSPTDYKLDPTRRPNGIMLINGKEIYRRKTYEEKEKGLILATNLPAYVKGNFNLHRKVDTTTPLEEFTEQLRDDEGNIDWSKFYTRSTLDENFACRKGDPRLPKCTTGDSWRSATVVSDAVTILSDNFRFGFRDEGDFDLRNNEGDFRASEYQKHGFFDNNFLTSSEWFGTNGFPKDFDTKTGTQGSSYVNNFVTPVQRRVSFGEYVMEICRKVPVSTCGPNDWEIGLNINGTDKTVKANKIPIGTAASNLVTGTTARVANNAEDRRYARRVAFLRDPNNNKLILDPNGAPIPIGVDKDGNLKYFPYTSVSLPIKDGLFDSTGTATPIDAYNANSDDKRPRYRPNALWFRTTKNSSNPTTDTNYGKKYPLFYLNQLAQETGFTPSVGNYRRSGADEQPLLVPVLQINMPYDNWTTTSSVPGDPGDDRPDLPGSNNRGLAHQGNWLQTADETTTNLVIAGGDTPGRPSESNGGLENFVRYLEAWRTTSTPSTSINSNISGSLIQYKRSVYATAPWQAIQLNTTTPISASIFGSDYPQYYNNGVTEISGVTNSGMSPFYTPPSRQWGFDVALLSQIPDLFAQQFTIPPATKPNKFFREVSRDDNWVKTLLCAKTTTGANAVPAEERPSDFCKAKTGG
jgi:hypothetical protein